MQPFLPYAFVVSLMPAWRDRRDRVEPIIFEGPAPMMRIFPAFVVCVLTTVSFADAGQRPRTASANQTEVVLHGAPSGMSTRSSTATVFTMSCALAATTR